MCVSMIGMSASGSAARAFFKTAGTAGAVTAAFTKGRRETVVGDDMGMGKKGQRKRTLNGGGIELADRLECDRGRANFLSAKRLTATANAQHGQPCAKAEVRNDCESIVGSPGLIGAEHLPDGPGSWSAQGL